MHVKNGKGNNLFVTPQIVKVGKDNKEVLVNTVSASLALSNAYLFETVAFTTETDNRLENKIARKAGHEVLTAISAGDAGDKFTYQMPDGLNDAGDLSDKWVKVMTLPRSVLVNACNSLIKADALLADAETKVKALAKEAGFPTVEVKMPVYATGSTGGRAKRASGTITI